MERTRFEALVARAIDNLPDEFRSKLENVDVVVEDWPAPAQLRGRRHIRASQLLGLYQGVPQTRRGQGYGLVLPDKISIFQRSIEAQCRSESEVEAKIGEVVRHEIAHHFGLDDATLRRIEDEKHARNW
jgi:predicted Zn-dependent protease with MMP-like domain